MKKDLDELLHAYGEATRLSPSEKLVERTKGKLEGPSSLRFWLVLAAVLGLPLLWAPFVMIITVPMPLPQLLAFSSMVLSFYNAIIIVMWLTRAQIYKIAREVMY